MDGRKFQIGNVSSYTVRKFFFSVYVDDIKLAGKKHNIDPMRKVLSKEVDLENQHFSLIMKTWDALESKTMKQGNIL